MIRSLSYRFSNTLKVILNLKESIQSVLIDLTCETKPVLSGFKDALLKPDCYLLLVAIYERSSEHIFMDAVG